MRKVRKALAEKLVYQAYLYQEIQIILDVWLGSITSWKQAYEQIALRFERIHYLEGWEGLRCSESKIYRCLHLFIFFFIILYTLETVQAKVSLFLSAIPLSARVVKLSSTDFPEWKN